MNALRLLTVAALGTAVVAAAAPAAQAQSPVLGHALNGTAKAAGVATRYAVPMAAGALGGKLAEKVHAAQTTLNGGTEAISGVNELVG